MDDIRRNLGKNVTLTGTFKEIVYKDHNNKVIQFFDLTQMAKQVSHIEAIFLNIGRNNEYSILIEGDAVKGFFAQFGLMKSEDLKKYMFTCNNFLLESSQGTEKPFSRIQSDEELQDFLGIEL